MEAVTIFLGAGLVVILVRIPRRLAPQHYFEIHEIIHGMNNAVTWQAIVLRFSIPFVVALIGALALRDDPVLVGLGIGFLASVLLVWPAFLDQRLLPWQVAERRTELYLLYGMFIASFTLLGLSAGFFASYLQGPLEESLRGNRWTEGPRRSRLPD